jgi:hypothetical protein
MVNLGGARIGMCKRVQKGHEAISAQVALVAGVNNVLKQCNFVCGCL